MQQAVIPIGVAYAQLLEDLRAVIRHELQHSPAPSTALASSSAEELLTVREAAELLDVTVQTIHCWKAQNRLAFYKMGSRSYLKRGDVLAALQAHPRTPATKPQKARK